MIELLKIIVLGFVQGVTEFLPISSTGHLIIASALLRPEMSTGSDSTFVNFIQLGSVIAVILYYFRDLLSQVRAIPTEREVRRFWMSIAIAVIPAGILGFLVRDFVKETLRSPMVVAIMLITGGIAFILLERSSFGQRATNDNILTVTPRQAVQIGIAQAIALIPGVSRSAASIFGGMSTGLTRTAATRFSFYLAIPTLGGATVIDLLLSLDEINSNDWVYLILGAVVAGIVSWFSIGWLLRYVSQHTFTTFGWYRIGAGIVILVLVAAGVL